ncbi:biosynthetic-type acetolactate synthase large subunit [Schlesneria paludicola]|uniref:biosynthetic-type acetolactate synthase large subunit n=1 Tax=Schlesneria paludicola TaxID=360056 RepID=UPI00029B2FDF|nr:biosynthetic-type acetolactate synthase large subunit [Schlesneria paludicola]
MSTITSQPVSTTTRTLTGADVFVECLIRHGTNVIFAYPGGCSMPLHQSLTHRSADIRTILPRHEQGGAFAAQGVSRTTDLVGVCMGTSGPGATNLVTAIADAKMDSIPMVAISAQVPTHLIGSDAFQETPMVEICRAITKHHYLVTKTEDIPRIIKEAFYIARTGRPGPVLIDVPKDVQLNEVTWEVDYDPEMNLPGYHPEVRRPHPNQIRAILKMIRESKKPIFYAGGGIIQANASEEFTKFARKTGIPVATTVMGIGCFPGDDDQSLHMLGMHGTVYSNYAINDADLLLAFGVRFDDRVTGKLSEFAKHGKIVHVDIDPSELHKNKRADIAVVANIKEVLQGLNAMIADDDVPQIDAWWETLRGWKKQYPLQVKDSGDFIIPQYAIEELWRQTKQRDTYITVGVGQHQMWAAQFYKFDRPRRWLSSSGLGTMGFGLPAAMGVQAAHPESLVVDIDGDGCMLMNVQELATLKCENLPVKTLLLNNQHLGMVMQWEDRFLEGSRAHTYLGPVDHPEAVGAGAGGHYEETYPNFVQIAKGFGLEAAQVRSKREFPAALKKMLEHDGPYLLDVICPYQEHVLPMIPGGKTVKDIIIE